MTPHRKRTCKITKRLAEDMIIRNLAPATIDAYTYHVRKFSDFIKKPLDRVTREDVRTFQLHLIEERKLAYSTFNQAVCALRFYYRHTQPMSWPVTAVPFGKRPKRLPTVLSRHDVDELIQCTENLKHRTFLMTLYSGGLRFSEAAHLRIPDIDSKRMMIRIASGKGSKERLVPLSPRLLKELRVYWRKYKPTDLLFPGKTPSKIYADTTIRKAMKQAGEKAGIKRRIYPHVLRKACSYYGSSLRMDYLKGNVGCLGSAVGSWRPWRTAMVAAITAGSKSDSRSIIHGVEGTTCLAGSTDSLISRRMTVSLTSNSLAAFSIVTHAFCLR